MLAVFLKTISFAAFYMLVPGPAMLAMVSHAISQPWKKTLLLIAGVRAGDALLLGSVLLGMAVLIKDYVFLLQLLQLGGAFYLLWIGFSLCRKHGTLPAKSARGHKAAFWAGFTTGIGNPKSFLLYLTVLPAMVNLADLRPEETAFVWITLICCYSLISLALFGSASKLRVFLQNDSWRGHFEKGFGAVMIAVALYTIFSYLATYR